MGYARFMGLVLAGVLAGAVAALAGEADVVGVVAKADSGGMWRFDVTVAHGDTGWDHYADRWDLIGPGGKVLGTRVLVHPHEAEQPFTRSLGGIALPADVTEVTVRARDSVHEYGGREMTIPLPR